MASHDKERHIHTLDIFLSKLLVSEDYGQLRFQHPRRENKIQTGLGQLLYVLF